MKSPQYLFFAFSIAISLIVITQVPVVVAGVERDLTAANPGSVEDGSPDGDMRPLITEEYVPASDVGSLPESIVEDGVTLVPVAGRDYVDIGPLPEVSSELSGSWVDATPMLRERGMVPSTPLVDAPDKRAGRDDVGDVRNFWAVNYQTGRWTQISGTCRASTDHCYVYVQDGKNYNQNKVDFIATQFNTTIYPKDTAVFGPPPDVDGIEQVYIFIYHMDGASGTGGYFTGINEVNNPNDPWFQFSNRCEMFYIDLGDYASWGQHIAAHEFQHVIHFGADANENTWVDEGCADLAILKCYGWVSAVAGHVNSFKNNPDKDLTVWGQTNKDYGASVCFIDYLEEHYGGDEFIRDLVQEPGNSINGINAVLRRYGHSDTFVDVFKNWTVANKLDSASPGGGMYNYRNISIRIPNTGNYNNTHYPVNNVNKNVHHWAADYYGFKDGIGMLEFSFNGHDNHEFALMAIKKGAGGTEIEELQLDSDQDGDFGILGLGPTYDEIIIAVSCINSGTGTVPYRFSADTSNKPVIIHEPIEDNNEIDGPHSVNAVVVDPDFNLNVSSLMMYYNKDGSSNYVEVPLDNVQGDEYTAEIPGPSENVTIFYYMSASDDNNVTTHPFQADPLDNSTVHSFIVVPDLAPPVIVHEPLKDTVFTGPFEILAGVVDDWFLDLDSVSLHYNSTSLPDWQTLPMAGTDMPDEFRAMLPSRDQGERINYYFTARDSYMVPNSCREPLVGYFTFDILVPATVLLVDDDQAGNHTSFDTYYREALNSTGIDYHVYTVPYVEDGPNGTILDQYDVVIWETGDEWGNYISEPEAGTTLTSSDRAALSEYLGMGGHLLLSGSFIGLELRYDSLFSTDLGILYDGAHNYTGSPTLSGVEDQRMTGDIRGSLENRSSDSAQRYVANYSVLGDRSEVILTSLNGTCNVGFRIETDVYRAVYFSFPFEEISDNDTRDVLMARVLEFLHTSISVEHSPVRSSIDVDIPQVVSVELTTLSPIESAGVMYSTDGSNIDLIPLVHSGETDRYEGEIPGQPGGTKVYYHVIVTNELKCRGFHPADVLPGDMGSWHNYTIFASDDEPPEIFHQAKYDVFYRENYTFLASASDNVDLNYSTFAVEYAFSDDPEHMIMRSAPFQEASPGLYAATVEAPPGRLFYRISISDIVGNHVSLPRDDLEELDLFFHDDLEKGASNWSFPGSSNPWELSLWNDTSFPGLLISGLDRSNSIFLSTGANSNYSAGANARVLSPEIDLTRAMDAELSFYMWANLTPFNSSGPLDSIFDDLVVEAYDKTGYTTFLTYNHTTIPMEDSWRRYELDLSPVAGRIVKLSWHLVDRDESAQGRGVAIDFIKVAGNFNNSIPSLGSLSCSPESGFNGSYFTFNVTYSDADNDRPEHIMLVLDNGTRTVEMVPVEEWDEIWTDGKNYTASVNLTLGAHDHFARARNMYDSVSTDLRTGPDVLEPNLPPVLELEDLVVIAGHELAGSIAVTDPDGDELTFEDNSSIIDIDPASGNFSWTPDPGDVGTYEVWVGVSDSRYEVWGSFGITVTANSPPVVTRPEDMIVRMGEVTNMTIEAFDPDNDTLRYYADNDLFTLEGEESTASFVPTRKDVGDHVIKVSVSDGLNRLVNITFRITVILVNDPPELLNGTVTPSEGDDTTRFVFTVAYVDTDGDDPLYVTLFMDGVPLNMTEVVDERYDFPGALVYLVKIKLDAGNHTYYFECKDGSGADNAVFRTGDRFIEVASSQPVDPGPSEEEENFVEKYLNIFVPVVFILLLLIVILILVMASRRRKKREREEEMEQKLSGITSCPVCKTEVGMYETVCPKCDFRLKKRDNIYSKKEDGSRMRACPGCYSKVSVREEKCPYCKTELEAERGPDDVPPEAELFMAEEELPPLRYKKPVTRTVRKQRSVRKRKVRAAPDTEKERDVSGLVFKRPDDYQGDGKEGDGDGYFERELAKIVGEDAEEHEEAADGDGEDLLDAYERWKKGDGTGGMEDEEAMAADIWDEDFTKDENDEIGDEDGPVPSWDDSDDEYAFTMESQDVWEDDEESGQNSSEEVGPHEEINAGRPVDGTDAGMHEGTGGIRAGHSHGPEEAGKDDEEGRSFQWLDADEEDHMDGKETEDATGNDDVEASFAPVWGDDDEDEDDDDGGGVNEDKGEESTLSWDAEDDDDYEIEDAYVSIDDDEYEDRTYVDAEFEVMDSYEHAGEEVAMWDDDDADDYFEVIKDVNENDRKSLGRTKRRVRRSRSRNRKGNTI